MNLERAKTTVEIMGIKTRGWLRLCVSVAGIALMLIAAHNMLLVPAGSEVILPQYRTLFEGFARSSNGSIFYIADFAAICVGAAVSWFS